MQTRNLVQEEHRLHPKHYPVHQHMHSSMKKLLQTRMKLLALDLQHHCSVYLLEHIQFLYRSQEYPFQQFHSCCRLDDKQEHILLEH
nr:MAG TPA: hypothetical protein [Caudoviricetes sp.]